MKSHCHYSFDGLTSAGPRWQDIVFKLYSIRLFKSQHKKIHKDKRMLKEGCMLYNVNPSFSVYRYLYSICACPLGIPFDLYLERETGKMEDVSFIQEKICILKFYCAKYDLLFDCFIAVISS